ncbi:MAG: hypothetical protein ACLFVC_06660 [Opitutales bacterium]
MALGQLEKIDPEAELERLAVRPFSAEVRGLKLGAEDWRIDLPTLEVDYSPWSLLAKHVDISRLHVEGVVAELDLAESETDEAAVRERLPGLWERTDLGWRISLDELAVDAQLKLADDDLSVSLSGGGLAPEATGDFKLEALRLLRTAEAGAVNEVALSGTLRLSESARGAMTALAWDLDAEVKGPLFESPPRLGISGDWSADDAWAGMTAAEAVEAAYPAESFSLKVTDGGETADGALLFEADGEYDAVGEAIGGRFQLHADNATLAPFAWATDLPQFEGAGDGEVDWDLAAMSGNHSMETKVDVSKLERFSGALQDVGDLRIEERHELSFEGDRVRLERFELGINDHEGNEVIALETSHPLTFSGATIGADNSDESGFQRPWLSLDTEIPLEWLDPVLGGLRLTGADLRGRVDFSGNPLEQLVISSEAPFEAQGTNLSADGSVLLEEVAVAFSPRLEVRPDKAVAALNDLDFSARGQDLLRGELGADIAFGAEEKFHANVNAEMEAFLEGLLSQDLEEILPEAATQAQSRVIEMSKALGPSSLKMSLSASARDSAITAESLSAELVRREGGSLLEARLLNPVKMHFGETGPEFEGMDGTWLEAVSRDLPVNALAVFVDGYRVAGGAFQGGFTLAAGAEPGGFVLEPTEAWSVNDLSIGPEEGELWVEAVDVTLRPGLDYSRGRAVIDLEDFRATRDGDKVLEGDLSADLALDRFDPESVAFSLEGRAMLVPLFEQPALAPLLLRSWEEATSIGIDMEGRTDRVGVDFSKLSLQWISEDEQALLSFALHDALSIQHLDIPDLDTALNAVEGKGSYTMDAFPLRLPLALIETAPLTVDAGITSGTFEWKIGQGRAGLSATDPLELAELDLSSNAGSLLEAVSLKGVPSLELSAKELAAGFDSIELAAGQDAPLTGGAGITFDRENALSLKTFNASLEGEVSPWFGQGFMPQNEVTGGRVDLAAGLDEAGRGSMELQLDDFRFRDEEPKLSRARIDASADREDGGDSWPGNATVDLETRGGRSDLAADFTWSNRAEGPLLAIEIDGDRLHAGDLQRLVREFGTARDAVPPPVEEEPDVSALAVEENGQEEQPEYRESRSSRNRLGRVPRPARGTRAPAADEAEPEWEAPPEEIDFDALADTAEAPEVSETDSVPFWEGLPADLDLTFSLDDAVYSDYLKFTDLAGKIVSNPQRVGLERFVAYFHEAEITASGGLDWDAEAATKPYALAMDFDVNDFDLDAFFSELASGEQARVEGLFRMTVNAEGNFPTLDAAPNHIRFLFDLESREGLFRAIPPNSPLARYSSEAAARAGSILSWTPTGGLALGALSRLVTAMREIPYNRIALKIVRGTDLNVHIEEMIMRSAEILIQGRGGILYEEGVDLVRQRMDLTAEMDARGNMAGILSGLGLLRQDRLENGYWRGFRFRIWGSLAEPKSNFGPIVTDAGAQALTHNVTNPFLGIWSNIKFRGTEAD